MSATALGQGERGAFGQPERGVLGEPERGILGQSQRAELAAAFSAVRAQPRVILMLLAVAGVSWWSTASQMADMDAGPGVSLGSFGWFIGVWAVMMAAMMLPSLAPTVALHADARRRSLGDGALFAGGYLLVWGCVGMAAYGLFALGKSLLATQLAWHTGGRWLAAGVLAFGALYELTPAKRACLTRCRSPRAHLRRRHRDDVLGALTMGARNGGWCVGCSGALMAALFALGVMSITWMVLIALLVGAQKLVPWRRAAVVVTALLLVALAAGILIAPHELPGLVVPGGGMSSMHAMKA